MYCRQHDSELQRVKEQYYKRLDEVDKMKAKIAELEKEVVVKQSEVDKQVALRSFQEDHCQKLQTTVDALLLRSNAQQPTQRSPEPSAPLDVNQILLAAMNRQAVQVQSPNPATSHHPASSSRMGMDSEVMKEFMAFREMMNLNK